MLKIVNAVKKYGNKTVIDDISLEFCEGKIYALVGPNGCGKTMVLKALSGYVKLTSGKVFQGDKEIIGMKNFIDRAGIIIESPKFIPDDTLYENLDFITKFCINKDIDLDYWIKFYELGEYRDKKYCELSLGTKQKMLLIQAFMDNPEVYILDECTNALDSKSVEKTMDFIQSERNAGKTIIMTSHINNFIESVVDEVIYIEEGKVVDKSSQK